MSGRGDGVAVRAGTPMVRDATSANASVTAQLKSLLSDRRGTMLVLAAITVITGLAESALLILLAETAATLATRERRARLHIGPLHLHPSVGTLLLAALIVVIVRLALQVPISILPPRIAAHMQAKLRTELFHSFSRASWDVQSRDREGQLQETMTGQVAQATAAMFNAMGLITSSLLLIVMLVTAFALNIIAAGFVVVLTISLFGFLRPLRKRGVSRARALSQAQVQYARGIAESIRVAEETQVFGAGEAQRGRMGGFIGTARGHLFATQVLLRLASNLYAAVISLLFIGALFILYELGRGHAASLGAIVLILVRASSSGQNVQSAYQGLLQSMPFVERTQETEQRYRESRPAPGASSLSQLQTLGFDHVGFAYTPGRPVLSDVSFEVNGGEVIGVIGPSGAGKSTLVQLLLRLRTPSEGSYLVNGLPAEEYSEDSWHSRVAYVPQEPRLLHASVAENIRFFRDIDDEAVQRAGRLARIHDDIMSWADGYETIVGPRADAVSGGQQQRICLARALVAQPEVLVLDEPTSALDPTSESLIQESLMGLKQQLTLFIVAHRMSTLDICDRVMIIIDGKLTAFDTIELLKRENSYYRSASKLTTAAPPPSDAAMTDSPEPPISTQIAAGSTQAVADSAQAVADPPASSANAPAVRMHVPDFFIVGHPKCGTTALYETLRRHPQIYMPNGKEPWFFAPELHVRTPPRPEGTPTTLEQYLALFADARLDQRVGEATALYLWSQTAASRIAEVQPDARIIAILREPASFLRSLHLQFVQTYVETEGDLRKALSLEDERRQGRSIPRHTYWPSALLYSEHVRYVEQLRRYYAVFRPENVLVLIYDDFRDENEACVRKVLRFLDVDDSAPIDVPQANPTVRARSQQLHELVHALSVGTGPGSRVIKETVKALTPRNLRRQALHTAQRRLIFSDPRPADEELMHELRRRYKAEVVALGEYLERDLVGLWGYGDVE